MVIWSSNEPVELFKPLLEVDDIASKVDGVVNDEANPHLGNGIGVDLLAELSQHVGCKGLTIAHLLDVGTVFGDDVE